MTQAFVVVFEGMVAIQRMYNSRNPLNTEDDTDPKNKLHYVQEQVSQMGCCSSINLISFYSQNRALHTLERETS